MSSPFADLDRMMALPRLGSLVLSPDGTRLAIGVATLDGDADAPRTRRATAVWEVDPAGQRPARRLTLPRAGDDPAGFTADGDLLLRSTRDLPAGAQPDVAEPGPEPEPAEPEPTEPDPAQPEPADAPAAAPSPDTPDPARPGAPDSPAAVPDTSALWVLPRGGGEPTPLATHPGGIRAAHATRAGAILVAAATLAGSATLADDARRRTARKATKVGAVLHDGGPVRHWDADLPAEVHRLYRLETPDAVDLVDPVDPVTLARLVDADPHAGESTAATPSRTVSVDDAGAVAVLTEARRGPGGAWPARIVAVDLATGERRVLLDGTPQDDPATAEVSPDGSTVAAIMGADPTDSRAPSPWLELVDAATGRRRRLADGWDRWPTSLTWLPDGSGLLVTADDHAHGPVFRIAVGDGPAVTEPEGTVRRLTGADAYRDVCVAPDGAAAYALRASWAHPEEIVRIDLGAAGSVVHAPGAGAPGGAAASRDVPDADALARLDEAVTALRGPAGRPELPGTLTEFTTDAADGTPLHSWLALPAGASAERPAPLLLWVHGGPLTSWNAWSWRWIPWVFVARGYAVLLPDPALSTGYGQVMVDRGWGAWGTTVFADLMAATDAAVARPEVDGSRTAAMGGSFGGYMANWIAGHTDRFDAIVSHAGLWALDQFTATTDHPQYWSSVLLPGLAAEHSPHRAVEAIRTPVLVIHGDKDYRVPVGEGLRLFTDLTTRSALPQGEDGRTAHRLLVFPDENHWILAPQNHKVWNQVVLGFLAEHVLGEGEAPRRLPLDG